MGSIGCPSCSRPTPRAWPRTVGLPAELVRGSRAVPSSYLRYYYCFDEVLAEQQAAASTRAPRRSSRSSASCSRCIAIRTSTRSRRCSTDRGGAFYSEAAAQLIASLHDGRGDVQVVDTRNGGGHARPAATTRSSRCRRASTATARILAGGPLEPEMRGLVQHAKAYEQLAVEAALSGDRDVALRALMANPLVGRL